MLHSKFRRHPGSQRGQIVILTAVVIPVVLGFTGLALDVGMLMKHRTEGQRAADAAAIAGAQALLFTTGDTSTKELAAKQAACDYAEENGYGTGTCPNDEVTIHLPPVSGAHIGDHAYVEVEVTRTDPTFFMRIFGISEKTVEARAVGATTPAKRNYALIVLNPTKCDAFSTSSDITINGGGAIVDSAATTGGNCIGESAVQNGGSVVTAQVCKDKDLNIIPCTLDYNTKGSWTVPNNSVASPTPTKAPLFPDPLSCGPPDGSQAHVNEDYCPRPVPCSSSAGTTPAGCVPWSTTSAGNGNKANNPTITQLTGAGEVTLEPGVYFGGLRINSSSQTVRFKPGIYVFAGSDHNGNGGGFDYQSGNLCGVGPVGTCPVATGVTFFNTSNPYASQSGNRPCNGISMVGSGLLKFAAPTVRHTSALTGYLNMLIWQDDNCAAQFKFAGSGSGPWSTTGLMYLPKAAMQVTGGGNFGSVQIIVDTFNQGGSQNIDIQFTRFIDTDISKYKLVE